MSRRLLIVTGMSGAGRSTCLKMLEDMGYEAVDNLPLPLLERLIGAEHDLDRDLAVGMDTRTRAFDPERLGSFVSALAATAGFDVKLIFFDCEDEVLQRRYTETRRRHPMAQDRPVVVGIERERRLLEELRDRADTLIDTSETTLPELRRLLHERFAPAQQARLTLIVMSFSYRHGVPREADLVFDVRFLRNPHYVDSLRPLTGLDETVQRHVAEDPAFEPFFDALLRLLRPLLPLYRREGKSYLTIALGCTGGQHRSVFTACRLAAALAHEDAEVTTIHRELARR